MAVAEKLEVEEAGPDAELSEDVVVALTVTGEAKARVGSLQVPEFSAGAAVEMLPRVPHLKIPTRDRRALKAWWADMKRTSIVRDWHSLAQGDPQPAEGALVSEELLRLRRDTTTKVEPQVVQDRVGLRGLFVDMEHEWSHWMSTDPDSPGRIDASCILVYGLIPEANKGAIVHAPLPQAPVSAAVGRHRRRGAYGPRIGK
ncbi:hypothetical protein ACFWNG_35590 [Streptomyces sp. NPDC058391]|uniref:hypothetical protein n=1 Tax=Streptomyces sp. NPDC058391 TaxID=3346476 RepID=UPI00365D071B